MFPLYYRNLKSGFLQLDTGFCIKYQNILSSTSNINIVDPFKLYHALIFSRIESKWKECRISENSTWRFSLITFVFLLLSESNISFIINLQQVSILLLGVFAGEIFNIALKYCLDSRPDKFIGILEHNTLFIVDGKYYQKYFRLTKDV